MKLRFNRPAVSVLEAMMALLIIAVAIMTVAQTLVFVARQRQLDRQRLLAVEQAANIMERASTMSWLELEDASSQNLFAAAEGGLSGASVDLEIGAAQQQEHDQHTLESRAFRVIVSWQPRVGLQQHVQLVGFQQRLLEAPQ